MAIGLPASYEEVIETPYTDLQLMGAVPVCIENLGWEIHETDDNLFTGKTLTGSLTMGERIFIRVKGHKIGMRSESAIPTQIIDFGKNKRMVKAFFEELNKVLETE
ncbi:MAG: hypothetical protein HKN92_12465 [Chitinophagales bacterium]|nr:hypothetical protein [Chitinophagales bacterium]